MRFLARKHSITKGQSDGLLMLCLMALATGLVTGTVIQLFRFAIEWPALLGLGAEPFRSIDPLIASGIVMTGATALGFFLRWTNCPPISMGVSHVVDRVTHYHGRMPFKAALLQFISATACILTGQSSGREGPAVHLGAASGSLLAQQFKLPSNSIRILAGCGTASAIAASFNTPIAGVIFAMEVILMEYTVAGFLPIILAASSGTLISHMVYGDQPAFIVPPLEIHSLIELPLFILIGVVTGCLAALFCFLSKSCLKLRNFSIITRFMLAGFITASLGFFIPEVFGIGYQNVDNSLTNSISLLLLLSIIAAKLVASATSNGLGMPIGIIGPTLVIGSCIGSAVLVIANQLGFAVPIDPLYAMVAMGTMMAAVLNAPLAALTAIVELTGSTSVVFPTMISIVLANLICKEGLKQLPPHITKLESEGHKANNSTFVQIFQGVSVMQLMSSNVKSVNVDISADIFDKLIHDTPSWIVIKEQENLTHIVRGIDFIQAAPNSPCEDEQLSLLSLRLPLIDTESIDRRCSALEAYHLMQQKGLNQLVITGNKKNNNLAVFGIITRQDFDHYFHQPRIY